MKWMGIMMLGLLLAGGFEWVKYAWAQGMSGGVSSGLCSVDISSDCTNTSGTHLPANQATANSLGAASIQANLGDLASASAALTNLGMAPVDGTTIQIAGGFMTGPQQPVPGRTVALLPTCNVSLKGRVRAVTDGLLPVLGAAIGGNGALWINV